MEQTHFHASLPLPLFLVLAMAVLVPLASCATDGVEAASAEHDSWHTVTSVQELRGTWRSENGLYEYPFAVDGKKYLRFSWLAEDDTALWERYASLHGMDVSELWRKRFAYAPSVYGAELPRADANGTQAGRKLSAEGSRILSELVLLIPENILLMNLSYFLMRDDGMAFTEQGSFYFASDVFADLPPDGTVYRREEL